jgi:hypothetical protein
MINGYRITKKNDWYNARAPEFLSQALTYIYGTAPTVSTPPALVSDTVTTVTSTSGLATGSCMAHALTLTTGPTNNLTFHANVYLPNSNIPKPSSGGYPICISSNMAWDPLITPYSTTNTACQGQACNTSIGPDGIIWFTNRGYIMAEYSRDEFSSDSADYCNDVSANCLVPFSSPVYTLYSSTYTWGVLQAWAWGLSRLLDYLLQSSVAASYGLDTSKVIGVGCSRGGEVITLAGMMDKRIALIGNMQSGVLGDVAIRCYTCGGNGPNDCGNGTTTLPQSFCSEVKYAGARGWYCQYASNFAGTGADGVTGNNGYQYFPFDTCNQIGAIAPRAYFGQVPMGFWDPQAANMCHRAARQIYTALGLNPNLIAQMQQNQGHVMGPGDFKAVIDFADYTFYGKALPTNDYFGQPFANAIFSDYYPLQGNNWSWTTPTLT